MQAGPVSTNTRLKSLMGSKWLVWGLLGLGIILLVLNLFIGGDSAPVTTSTEATQGENLPVAPPPETNDIVASDEGNLLSGIWQWAVSEENSWIVSGIVMVALIAIIFFLMRYSGVSAGKLSRTSVTIIGYLVLGVMIVLFKLLPTDIIVDLSGIIMLILGGMVLLSLLMIITGWGNKLAWVVLLVGFGILMFNPVESTATRVTETARTIQEEGLKGIAPSVTPMVPNIIYMSPEEKAAARRAEAEARAIEAEAEKQRIINEAVAQAAAEAEAAKYRPLTTDAFLTKTIGTFEPLQIRSRQRVGPINFYKDTCFYWSKSGMGMFFVYSRIDFVSEPVLAKFQDHGYGIKSWNQPSAPVQVFLEAKNGDIQIELERREGSSSCK